MAILASFGMTKDPETAERWMDTEANKTHNKFRTRMHQQCSKFPKVAAELLKMLRRGERANLEDLAKTDAALAEWLAKEPRDPETRPCVPQMPALGGVDWGGLKRYFNPELGEVI